MSLALVPCLEAVVHLRILEILRMGYIPDSLHQEVAAFAEPLSHADALIYGGGKKGQAAEYFNKTALAIAVLSFQPGGIEIFGLKFESAFPIPDSSQIDN